MRKSFYLFFIVMICFIQMSFASVDTVIDELKFQAAHPCLARLLRPGTNQPMVQLTPAEQEFLDKLQVAFESWPAISKQGMINSVREMIATKEDPYLAWSVASGLGFEKMGGIEEILAARHNWTNISPLRLPSNTNHLLIHLVQELAEKSRLAQFNGAPPNWQQLYAQSASHLDILDVIEVWKKNEQPYPKNVVLAYLTILAITP